MAPIFTLPSKDRDEDRLVFRADGREMPVPYANCVRRFLYSRLPVVAIDSTTVVLSTEEGFENGTSDDDELLRRQIGWTPLIVPVGQEEGLVFRICDPEDHARPYVHRHLASMVLTCRHVQVTRNGEPVAPETVFAHMDFPLTTLGYGESLLCEFRAAAGTASNNPLQRRSTDFQPICVAAMRFELSPEKEANGFQIPEESEYEKLDAHAPAGLIWTLELATTPSTYTCERAMSVALDEVVRDVNILRKAWEARDVDYVRVEEESAAAMTTYWMGLDGYSMFGMVQHAFNEVVAKEGLDANTHFCGFRETHPQEKQMQVTVLVPDNGKRAAPELFKLALDRVLERCMNLQAAWRQDILSKV